MFCSLESLDTCRPVAETLAELQQAHPELNILFKGSFDKANRTSIKSDRGTGLEAGLDIFRTIKAEYGFKTITDIHLPEQCATVGPSSMPCKSRPFSAARPTSSSLPLPPTAPST